MAAPMLAGLIIRARLPAIADKLMSPVVWTSYIMILVVFITFLMYKIFSPDPVGGLRDLFGTMGILAIILAVGISLILGYLLGGPADGTRRSLAFGSANHNAGMALLFATSISSEIGDILAVLVAYIIVQIVMSAILAAKWRKNPEVNGENFLGITFIQNFFIKARKNGSVIQLLVTGVQEIFFSVV